MRSSTGRDALWGVGSVMVLVLSVASGVRADSGAVDPGQSYEIVYEASDAQAKVISNARVIGVITIGGREFLVIAPPSAVSTDVRGYLSMESVRSILPPGSF